LLVSVRSALEVEAALDGGADIVDAKDPSQGALGAMQPDALRRVLDRVPGTMPFSAALGDPRDAAEAASLVTALPILPRPAPSYVKLSVAATADAAAAECMLGAAVEMARLHPGLPLVIAVAYADDFSGLDLDQIAAIAAHAGAHGVLVDTMWKSGGSLLDRVPLTRLSAWIAEGRKRGLLVAVAGRLDGPGVAQLATSGADIVGVRGAACDGGRTGRVSAARVRALRDLLGQAGEERRDAAKHQSDPESTTRSLFVTPMGSGF
jgi:uncharacterized protein (UPF0264 family)